MSPMRRVAEAAHRTPEAQYTNNTETPREFQEMADTQHVHEERLNPETISSERNIPTTNEQYSNQWENNNGEPEIIVEQAPLLNGGPPTL